MRRYRRNSLAPTPHWWSVARLGDDDIGIPFVCVCATPRPDGLGECQNSGCRRPWVGLWKPRHRAAARRAYPELASQVIPEGAAIR